MSRGYFIVDRIEFDQTERGERSLEGISTDGGQFGMHRTMQAAEGDASKRAMREPGVVFGVFELVAFAEEKPRR
jgi:hypothetical protein